MYNMYLCARQILIKHDWANKKFQRAPAAVFEMSYESEDKVPNKSIDMCCLESLYTLTLSLAQQLIDQGTSDIDLVLVMDARSISALTALNVKVPASKGLFVHLRWLRHFLLVTGVLNSIIWCDTRSMPSEVLTKRSIDHHILHQIRESEWAINELITVCTSPLALRRTWTQGGVLDHSVKIPTDGAASCFS